MSDEFYGSDNEDFEMTPAREEQKPTAPDWVRGILEGGQLIKTDRTTGKSQRIERAEWESLP